MAADDIPVRVREENVRATTSRLKDLASTVKKFSGSLGSLEGDQKKAFDGWTRMFAAGGKLGGVLSMLGPQAQIASVALNAVGQAASMAATAMVRVAETTARFFKGLIDIGGETEAVAHAFEQIASPRLLAQMQHSSGGFVQNIDLMRHAVRTLRADILDEDQLVGFMQQVTRSAQDMRIPVQQAMEIISNFASGGGTEALQALGVNVLRVREELQGMGMNAETTAGRYQALNRIMGQMRENLGQVDNSASNVGDALLRVTTTVQNWGRAVARRFAENRALIDFFERLNKAIQDSIPDANRWGDELADIFADVLEAVVDLARALIPLARALLGVSNAVMALATIAFPPLYRTTEAYLRTTSQLDRALSSAGDVLRRVSSGIDTVSDSMRAGISVADIYIDRLEDVQITELNRPAGADMAGMSPEERRRWLAQNRPIDPGPSRRGPQTVVAGGITISQAELDEDTRRARVAQLEFEVRWENELEAKRQQNRQRGREAARRAHEARMEQYEQELRVMRELQEQEEERRESLLRFQDEEKRMQVEAANWARAEAIRRRDEQIAAHERMLAFVEELDEAHRQAAEAQARRDQAVSEKRDRRLDDTVSQIEGYTGAVLKLGDAIASAYAQSTQHYEEGSKEAKKAAKVEGGLRAAFAFVESAIEYAKGIGAIAKYDYVAAASHFASGIAFDVAGALALANLGGSASRAPGAGAEASSSFVADRSRAEEGEGEGGPAGIQVYTWGSSSARLAQEFRRADWQLSRSGFDSPMSPVGQYS